MLYGVDYRDFHTALHGILVFEQEGEADEAYRILKYYAEYDWEYPEDYVLSVNEVFDRAYDVIKEIDYRNLDDIARSYFNGRDVKIVNNVFVDVF